PHKRRLSGPRPIPPRHYSDDPELLPIESSIIKDVMKDSAGAEALLLRLIRGRETEHFGSVDTGLRGYKARHNLACVYYESGRFIEAESQWRTALVDEPAFLPAHLGLAELYMRTRNWPGLERAVADLRGLGAERRSRGGSTHWPQPHNSRRSRRRSAGAGVGRRPVPVGHFCSRGL